MTKEQAIERAKQIAQSGREHIHVLVFNGDFSVATHPKQGSIFTTVLKVTPKGTILYPVFNNNGRRVFVTVPA